MDSRQDLTRVRRPVVAMLFVIAYLLLLDVEVVYQQTATPEYQDFRAEAELHARQREDCFRKAAQAFQQKRGELAQYYSNQGHLHTEKMLEANRRASRLILTTK